ncbi:hypothetical protein HK097_007514 [Rhizophlyctis rosea]|uniref:HTH APSES-type domain-containing protein n=1 Tax=Rhizophlyctis rosea TaxID=64517 RepID=A0AAD5X4I2_9FUNG|nr:hypothetical protein HK097_007514 [Rhizophlyctis rosea]
MHPDDARDKVFTAIVKALLSVGNRPCTPRELSGIILREGLVGLGGNTPYATVSSRISQHFKRTAEYRPGPRPALLGRKPVDVQSRRLRYFVHQEGVTVADVDGDGTDNGPYEETDELPARSRTGSISSGLDGLPYRGPPSEPAQPTRSSRRVKRRRETFSPEAGSLAMNGHVIKRSRRDSFMLDDELVADMHFGHATIRQRGGRRRDSEASVGSGRSSGSGRRGGIEKRRNRRASRSSELDYSDFDEDHFDEANDGTMGEEDQVDVQVEDSMVVEDDSDASSAESAATHSRTPNDYVDVGGGVSILDPPIRPYDSGAGPPVVPEMSDNEDDPDGNSGGASAGVSKEVVMLAEDETDEEIDVEGLDDAVDSTVGVIAKPAADKLDLDERSKVKVTVPASSAPPQILASMEQPAPAPNASTSAIPLPIAIPPSVLLQPGNPHDRRASLNSMHMQVSLHSSHFDSFLPEALLGSLSSLSLPPLPELDERSEEEGIGRGSRKGTEKEWGGVNVGDLDALFGEVGTRHKRKTDAEDAMDEPGKRVKIHQQDDDGGLHDTSQLPIIVATSAPARRRSSSGTATSTFHSQATTSSNSGRGGSFFRASAPAAASANSTSSGVPKHAVEVEDPSKWLDFGSDGPSNADSEVKNTAAPNEGPVPGEGANGSNGKDDSTAMDESEASAISPTSASSSETNADGKGPLFSSVNNAESQVGPPIAIDPERLELTPPSRMEVVGGGPMVWTAMVEGVRCYICWVGGEDLGANRSGPPLSTTTVVHSNATTPLLRRVDNNYVNATLLLHAGGLKTDHERSVILSLERGRVRNRKAGSLLAGTWIPLARAQELARSFLLEGRVGGFLGTSLKRGWYEGLGDVSAEKAKGKGKVATVPTTTKPCAGTGVATGGTKVDTANVAATGVTTAATLANVSASAATVASNSTTIVPPPILTTVGLQPQPEEGEGEGGGLQ